MNGRAIINLVIGIFALYNVGYKLMNCPLCPDRFFGFEIPGIVYLAIWVFFAVSCFVAFNKQRKVSS